MIIDVEDYLMHYGTPRHSGRYPWGSGQFQNQRHKSFLDHVEDLKRQGLSEDEIANGFGISKTQLRDYRSIARNAHRNEQILTVRKLAETGMSNVAIGTEMGIPESTVRTLRSPDQKIKLDIIQTTADSLRRQVDANRLIDIGTGVENHMGVSKEKLRSAVQLLKDEGYEVHYFKVPQIATGKETSLKILVPPGQTKKDTWHNLSSLRLPFEYTVDGGKSYEGFQTPIHIDSKRLAVRYKEEGGANADGVIYVRPGAKDLSLGGNNYAQVRISVDGTHYLKGMAVLKDDLPAGVDLMFNTNKSDTGNKLDALKPQQKGADGQIDKDLPFGSIVRQMKEELPDGTKRVTSAMNIVNEKGDWDKWNRTLSSQMLSKQSPSLIKEQLNTTYERRAKQYDEIVHMTNPEVRRKLLEDFAEDADSAAVHMKAAGMPRQSTHVILPINSLKETEIYAPNFNHGERVVLIRFPHGGTFEIPELVVNNNNREGKKTIGSDAKTDAVGINAKVAERLSGADFDGDTVLVIPNNDGRIKSTPALEGLKNFDPKALYAVPKDQPVGIRTQREMGDISNLITDMTVKGAPRDHLARAVRHSMVVIDAEKHNLDYKQSAKDNGIADLKTKYQGGPRAGAATLISRKKREISVNERRAAYAKEGGPIDPATGKLRYVETGRTYPDKKGNLVRVKQSVKEVSEVDDVHSLSSGLKQEALYADHSNRLKDLANQARKELVSTPKPAYNPSSARVYKPEVERLTAGLEVAKMNAPLERQAQLLANALVKMKTDANPHLKQSDSKADLKKIKFQALAEARLTTGAGKQKIKISEREWEAIQAGALRPTTLRNVLDNSDMDIVKAYATPKAKPAVSTADVQRAQSMLLNGATNADVARALGVSVTTLKKSLSEL